MAKFNCCILLLYISSLIYGSLAGQPMSVTYDGTAVKINGQRKIILSGSIHYPRSTPNMWGDLIWKAKQGGLNTIETYVFWNAHEPVEGQFDFGGRLDLVRFIKTIQDQGMYAMLRIGPYVCAEWNYGGLPVWLHHYKDIKFRTNNAVFENAMKNFVTKIVKMMKRENLFASEGGPIILAQIENEFGNIQQNNNHDQEEYVKWCANIAENMDAGVPWIMCQQKNAPAPMINTCNGFYCDDFTPVSSVPIPKGWTENWTGWFKAWGQSIPTRPAEDVAFSVARFFQKKGTLLNYYMFHGGTNFGRTSGGPYITTSYDYDAPLDEYGSLRQPKYSHLQQLHYLLQSVEQILLYGYREHNDLGKYKSTTSYNYQGKCVAFLANVYNGTDRIVRFQGREYDVPPWSVTILLDCYKEGYNTAKLNSQTSNMIHVPNEADDGGEPQQLEWLWRSERIEDIKHNGLAPGSVLTTNKLLNQMVVTNDTSDYLWYMTRFDLEKDDPLLHKHVTLRVNTNGHVLHAFLNKHHLGTHYHTSGSHYNFTYEAQTKLKEGTNYVSLVSATVGLPNYGKGYPNSIDAMGGICGPVKIVDPDSGTTLDLTSNEWIYKIGIQGIKMGFHKVHNRHRHGFHFKNLPTNRPFVWYKSTFPTPLGTDPVVVDLLGLGKGEAWVNGHSIGRYWPSYTASQDGCNPTCEFSSGFHKGRGFNADQCRINCGQPSQRWYHIPREFLNNRENHLTLFEEFGGTPDNVNIQTITVGSVCGHAHDGYYLDLACQGGRMITGITFASFGMPQGTCGSFRRGECEAPYARQVIEQLCLGKQFCRIPVTEFTLGPTGCHSAEYKLAVEATC